jgi:NhaA family Na+:H+ antiporter
MKQRPRRAEADGKMTATPARAPSALREFIENSASGGIVLMVSAPLAMIIANSALAPVYFAALKSYIGPLSVLHWINDALMAVFFLLVGLEIKREFLDGQLSTWPGASCPELQRRAACWHPRSSS